MHDLSKLPLLADLDNLFAVIFFVIAFIGWIANAVKQSVGSPDVKRPLPGGPRSKSTSPKKKSQSEIDDFLSQARSQRKEQQRSGTRETAMNQDSELSSRRPPRRRHSRDEIVQNQPQTGSGSSQRKPKPQQSSRSNQSSRPGQQISNRSQQKNATFSQRPLRQQLSNVSAGVEQHLPHSVNRHVNEHLQNFSAEDANATGQIGRFETTNNASSAGRRVANLLKSKHRIRNAIIINEVLSPPISMRRNKKS